jgi:hypothetical protein
MHQYLDQWIGTVVAAHPVTPSPSVSGLNGLVPFGNFLSISYSIAIGILVQWIGSICSFDHQLLHRHHLHSMDWFRCDF